MKISKKVTMDRQKRKKKSKSSIKKKEAFNDGIDCGNKICFLEYQVMPDCVLILETNNTNCKIPCVVNGCETELHHYIQCPVWNCQLVTTTTTSSTTTTPRPNPPNPNKPSNMSALIYTSIVFNIFLFAMVFAYFIVKFRQRITARWWPSPRVTVRVPDTELPNPNRFFSLGDELENERLPLLLGTDSARLGGSLDSNLSIVNANVINEAPAIMSEAENVREIDFDEINLAPSPSENQNADILSQNIQPDSIPNTVTVPNEPTLPSLVFKFIKLKKKTKRLANLAQLQLN
jgi:hypothetical protein